MTGVCPDGGCSALHLPFLHQHQRSSGKKNALRFLLIYFEVWECLLNLFFWTTEIDKLRYVKVHFDGTLATLWLSLHRQPICDQSHIFRSALEKIWCEKI
jgi:hypothetical protein